MTIFNTIQPTERIRITSVNDNIMTARYNSRCMECHCDDDCCSYGCPVDVDEVAAISVYRNEIELRLGIPFSGWFHPEIEEQPAFPSARIQRTRVINGKCVFHDGVVRGCHLHRFAMENGIDPHLIKPMVCFLFPITWDGSHLHVSEFLDELPCKDKGESIFMLQRNELCLYLGEQFVREIDDHDVRAPDAADSNTNQSLSGDN